MSEISYRDPSAAFDAAIAAGRLSTDTSRDNYAGHFMYMGTSNGCDAFKNIYTREYLAGGAIMSNTQHTPTPWDTGTANGPKGHAVCSGPFVIAQVLGRGYPSGKGWSPSSEADAAHIVKCVNAHEALCADNASLRASRGELVTALRLISSSIEALGDWDSNDGINGSDTVEVIMDIRSRILPAALAKVQS